MHESNQKNQRMLNHFHESFKSIILSTITPDSAPYASYAPMIKWESNYYFIISKIAQHYSNLSHNPIASILMIEDESQAKNVFFRKRLSYLVDVEMGIDSSDVKNEFIKVFGDIVHTLFKMDFVIVKCQIRNGNIIVGPGQAFMIDENQIIIDQLTGNNGNGHNLNDKI